MTIPVVQYECIVMDGKLIRAPFSLDEFDDTPANAARFVLPGIRTAYSGAIYQWFEQQLKAECPDLTSLLTYADHCMEQTQHRIGEMTPDAVRALVPTTLRAYREAGLPEHAFGGDRLAAADRRSIAEQHTRHGAREWLAQPTRKLYCAWHIADSETREQLAPPVTSHIERCRGIVASPRADPIASAYVNDVFTPGITAMLRGEYPHEL